MASDIIGQRVQGFTSEINEGVHDIREQLGIISGPTFSQASGGSNIMTNNRGETNIDHVYSGAPVDLDLMLYSLEKNTKRKKQCFELILYIPFVVLVLIWLLFSTLIDDAHYMNVALKNLLITREYPQYHIHRDYKMIGEIEEYWDWLEGVLVPGLFGDEWYKGRKKTTQEKLYITSYNRLIGSLRIRQHRVSNNSCTVSFPVDYGVNPTFDPGCYDEYSDSNKDTTPFGPNGKFKYFTCEEMGGGMVYIGRRKNYECGGYPYFINFRTTNKEKANDIFEELMLVLEWFESGSVLPTWSFRVFKLETLRTTADAIMFVLSLMLPVYVFYYIYLWFKDMYFVHQSRAWYYHLLNFWNIIDLINFIIFLTTFALRLMWYVHHERLNFRIVTDEYPRLDEVAFLYVLDLQVSGINAIITCFKIFKYFSLNDKLNLLIRTIEDAAPSLIGVFFMLLLSVGAFSCAGFLLFGWNLDAFKDPLSTISTLLRMLVGDFDYEKMREANRLIFPIFFVAYMAITFFLIFQLFLAVINESFGKVNNSTVDTLNLNANVLKSYLAFAKDKAVVTAQKIADPVSSLLNRKKSIARTVTESPDIKFNHGDVELVERLRAFQEMKNGASLTIDDLRMALGPEANKALIERVMKRFDADGSGTIEIEELVDEFGNVRPLVLTKEEMLKQQAEQKEAKEKEQMKLKIAEQKEKKLGEMMTQLENELQSMTNLLQSLQQQQQQPIPGNGTNNTTSPDDSSTGPTN